MRRRIWIGALAVAFAASACSGEDDPVDPGSLGGEPSLSPVELDESPQARFRIEAGRACTDLVNGIVVDEDLGDVGDTIEVAFMVARGADEPTDAEREEWAGRFDVSADLSRRIADTLGAVPAPTGTTEAWEAHVASYAEVADTQEGRAEALRDLPWSEVGQVFRDSLGAGAVGDLAAMGLAGTDCTAVRTDVVAYRIDAGARDFVVAATDICADIDARRVGRRLDADLDTVVTAIGAVVEEEELDDAMLDDLEDALGRVVEEWRAVAADLGAIDPASTPDPRAWTAVFELASEREALAQRRLDAVRERDEAGVREALAPAVYTQPGLEVGSLVLTGRNCAGLRS